MSDSQDRVSDLIRSGLDFYGRGDVVRAVECWEEALSLDPGNQEARDYLETARSEDDFSSEVVSSGDTPRREAFGAPDESLGASHGALIERETRAHRVRVDSLLAEAQQLLREEQLEDALDLFRTAASLDSERIEIEGYVDLARSRLYKRYRERLGAGDRTPHLAVDAERITRFNLPPDAGFVLSLVDGATTYDQITSLSGMDAFETLRILASLLDAEIVKVEE